MNTNHLGANWGVGVTYGMFGQSAKAEEQFKKVICFSPNFAAPYYHLALTYLAVGANEKAVDELLILEKLDPKYADSLKEEMKHIIESNDEIL